MVRLEDYRALRSGGASGPTAGKNQSHSSHGQGQGQGHGQGPARRSEPASRSLLRRAYVNSPRPFTQQMTNRMMTYPESDDDSALSNDGSESKDDWAPPPPSFAPVPVAIPPPVSSSSSSSSSSTSYRRPLPIARPTPGVPSAFKKASHSTSTSRKMVTFKNAYMPDLVPNAGDYLESYDDLIYRVAGLYHTLTGFIEPDWDPAYQPGDSDDLEARSVTLQVAEFLFRSAVFLGYKPPPEQSAWLSGFRECKKFSTNDVRRWRRLCHHNWDKDERTAMAIPRERGRPPARGNGDRPRERSNESRHHVRKTMGKLFHRRHERRSDDERQSQSPTSQVSAAEDDVDRHIDLDNPPMVPDAIDLTQLVVIANTCVYYGSYQFSERGIRKLANRKID